MADRSIIALDYGDKRIGVALSAGLGFAEPVGVLTNTEGFIVELRKLITKHFVTEVVIGLPRNLDGDDTPQTTAVREFAAGLKSRLKLPVYLIDEAATSVEAETRLKVGKKAYHPADIDALSAALILEDFLANEIHINQA